MGHKSQKKEVAQEDRDAKLKRREKRKHRDSKDASKIYSKSEKEHKQKKVKAGTATREVKDKNSKSDWQEKRHEKASSASGAADSVDGHTQSSDLVHSNEYSAEGKQYLEENAIHIESIKALNPITDFAALKVDLRILATLDQLEHPTPIQAATWPYLLNGNDVVGVAETGSGKTLAFGVPLGNMLAAEPSRKGVFALVVAPTRELAMQIEASLEPIIAATGKKLLCIYGGVTKYQQQMEARKASLVVGTPGRIIDLLNDGSLSLSKIKYFVLDEADRMLDRGFEPDIRAIMGHATNPHQTVMFTATWPPEVRQLAIQFLDSEFVRVTIGESEGLTANRRIEQHVHVISPNEKERYLFELLEKYAQHDSKVLVFVLYKKEAERVEQAIRRRNYRVAAIHGNLTQNLRTQALHDFRSGKCNILLATDVAARGLDIPNVSVVINMTFPLTVEDYVHRIGRTGRAGKTGIAHTLFTEQEKNLAGALTNVLKSTDQPVPDDLLRFGTHTKKKEHSLYGAFYRDVDVSKKATKIVFE